jgi:hypothetical protein
VKSITFLDKILVKSEYREMTSKMKNKSPSYIDVVDTPDVEKKFRRPPTDPVDAGFIVKYFTVAVFSGDHKIVTKNNQGMLLRLCYENPLDKSESEISSLYSDKPYKEGKYCFKTYTFKPPELQKAGIYSFKFKCDIPDVKEKSFQIIVKSGPAVSAELQEIIDEEIKLGETIPELSISFLDQFENIVGVDLKAADVKINVNKNEFILDKKYEIKMDENTLRISNLKFSQGKIVKSEKSEKLEIDIVFGSLNIPPLQIPLNIFAGSPSSIQLSKESLDCLESSLISKILPPLRLFATDSYGNRVYDQENLKCTASGDFLKENFESTLTNGVFEFSELTENNLMLNEDIDTSTNLKLTFSLNTDPVVKTSCTVTIDPNLSQPKISKIKIIPSLTQKDFLISNHSKDAEICCVVNSEIVGWKAEIADEYGSRIDFAGYVSFDWEKGEEIRFDKGIINLPTLAVAPTPKTLNYKFKIDNHDFQFDFKLKITSIIGPPVIFVNNNKNVKKYTCGEEFTLSIGIHDEYGNLIDLNLHSEVSFNFLKLDLP